MCKRKFESKFFKNKHVQRGAYCFQMGVTVMGFAEHFRHCYQLDLELSLLTIPYTVCVKHSRSICFLWYNLIALWPIKSTPKKAEKPIFFPYRNKHRSNLSKRLVFDPEGPLGTKLWALKVCSDRTANSYSGSAVKKLHFK